MPASRSASRSATKTRPKSGPTVIACAVGAVDRYPGKDLVIIDFGTATTIEAVNAEREYLGGVIVPGLSISMRALEQNTARLPKVEIIRPDHTCGRSTVESIQAGLFWGHLGATREIRNQLVKECFRATTPVVVGTGGFAGLFAEAGIFSVVHPDLVLEGVRIAQERNQ